MVCEIDVEGNYVYSTADEIPIAKQYIQPINVEGLPKYNTIIKFMEYVSTISDTYPEFLFQGGLAMLSVVARRRIYMKLNGKTIYPYLWLGNLGQSGYARKSVAMDCVRDVVDAAKIGDLFLPIDVTPEGLLDELATRKRFKRDPKNIRSKKSDDDEPVDLWESVKYDDIDGIKRSQRMFMRDEIGQFFAQMQNPRNAYIPEMFLSIRSAKDVYCKRLKTEETFLDTPYMPMLWATTPTSLRKNITMEDVGSGFIARHLIVAPSYQKAHKKIREDEESDLALRQAVIDDVRCINRTLANGELRLGFQPGVLDILDEWVVERETYYNVVSDDDKGSFLARFQENAIMMAMLIELGNIPHISSDKSNAILTKLKISMASMVFTLKMFDTMYSPYLDALDLRETKAIISSAGDVAKVEKIVSKYKKISYSKALGYTKLKAMVFREAVDTLREAGRIASCYAKDNDRKAMWLVYVPPDPCDVLFKVSYAKAKIPEYMPDMDFMEILPQKTGLSPELSTVGASDRAVLYSSKAATLSKTGNAIVDATINESLGSGKPIASEIFKKSEVPQASQKLTASDIFKKSDVAEAKLKLVNENNKALGNDQKSSPNTLQKSDEVINFTNREKLTASDIFKRDNLANSSPVPIHTSELVSSGRIGSPSPTIGMQNMLRKSRITSPAPIRSRNDEVKKQKINNYSSAPTSHMISKRTSALSPKFNSAKLQSPTPYSMTSKSKYPSSPQPNSSVLAVSGKISSSRPGPIISSRPGPISSSRPSPIAAIQQISPFPRASASSQSSSPIPRTTKQTIPSSKNISGGSPSPSPSPGSQNPLSKSPLPIGGGSSSNYPRSGANGGSSGDKRKYRFITRDYQEEKKQKDRKALRFDIKQAMRARDKQLTSNTKVATFEDMYGSKAKRKSSPFKK